MDMEILLEKLGAPAAAHQDLELITQRQSRLRLDDATHSRHGCQFAKGLTFASEQGSGQKSRC
jgi:hypothetical protein